jgi:hypothetical protein
MGGRPGGRSIRVSVTSARRESSASPAQGSKARSSMRNRRLISALLLRQRQTRSGLSPIRE